MGKVASFVVSRLKPLESDRSEVKIGTVTRRLLYMGLVLLIVGLTLRFTAYVQVSGSSMEPTFSDGDSLLLLRASEVKRGDYILFPMPDAWLRFNEEERNRVLIKRVAAGPGDELAWNGRDLTVNGVPLRQGMPNSCRMENFSQKLRPHQAFVVGDNGTISLDSRRVMCDGSYSYLVNIESMVASGSLLARF